MSKNERINSTLYRFEKIFPGLHENFGAARHSAGTKMNGRAAVTQSSSPGRCFHCYRTSRVLKARALRGRTRIGLARLDARGAGIGQSRRNGDQRRNI